jgi:hypothetical protein
MDHQEKLSEHYLNQIIMGLLFWLSLGLTFFTILYIEFSYSIVELRNEWSKYRCNPLYMPFAGWVDPDTGIMGNFERCMNLVGKDLVSNMSDSMGGQISLITDSLTSILNPLKMFRTMFTTIRQFILAFTNTTLSKINGPVSAFSYLLIKIQDLLQKMSASGYVTALFGLSAVSFVQGFISLFIAIVKGFIIAMLIIAIVLALFNFPLLALVLFIASLLQGI